jgi:transglutaminase-like putative cysteine protease
MSRSLVYTLVLSILMVTAPHALHLPIWVSGLCGLLLAWRAYLAYVGKPLPPHRLLLLLAISSVGAVAAEFETVFGREVGVTMLALLSALKLMELRATRDVMTLVFLSCFMVITNFFYSQTIPTALYMLLTLVVVLATWLHVQMPNASNLVRWRFAGMLLLKAIPLTLILFVLFPRVDGPLWGMPQDAHSSSGLGDTMSPGSLSKLSLSDAVAFRVNYEGQAPRRDQMYWRGPVLWDFDGRTWTPGYNPFPMPPQITEAKQSIDYRITLEPHNKLWLFALDVPTSFSIPATMTDDFQVLNKEAVTSRLRYKARSVLSYRINVMELDQQLKRAARLPKGFNPRTRMLAESWRAEQADDRAVVNRALRYFNEEKFSYTLEPPLLGANSVDDFVFGTKQGFCEHYASAFVFLMRAAGIPARVVTGYLGGEFNSVGQYYIVRQSDAHAWTEVFLEKQGWVRVDPTAAIAPDRVQRNLAQSVDNNAAMSFMARNPPQWLRKLSMNWDAAANQWNQWVLGYNSERQFDFLTRLGMEEVTWQKMATTMGAGLAALIGLFTLLMMRQLFVQSTDQVHAAWLKLCARFAKIGLPRAEHEGANDYAQRVAHARPDLAASMRAVAHRYNRLRYGEAMDKAAQREWLRQAAALMRKVK